MREPRIRTRLTAVASAAALSLLIVGLAAAIHAPATGYESSIYVFTPWLFWIAVIIVDVMGIALIVTGNSGGGKPFWLIGVCFIILANCLTISLHSFRGYFAYMGRGDSATYIGMAKDVTTLGYYSETNPYPLPAILISGISQIAAVPDVVASAFVPCLFMVVYVLSIYCIAKSMGIGRAYLFSSLAAASPIFFAGYATSLYFMFLATMTLPLFIYFLIRSESALFRFLAILWVVILPLYHPYVAMLAASFLIIIVASHRRLAHGWKCGRGNLTFVLLFGGIVFAYWVIQSPRLIELSASIISQALGMNDSPSSFSKTQDLLANLSLADFAVSSLLMLGDEIVYMLMALVAIFQIMRSSSRCRKSDQFMKLLPIGACIIGGSLLLGAAMLLTRAHVLHRLLNLNGVILLTVPLVAVLLSSPANSVPPECVRKHVRLRRKPRAVLVVITILTVATIFSAYPSPFTSSANNQVSISDIWGMQWLIEEKNRTITTADIASPVERFSDLIFGHESTEARPDLQRNFIVPDHFGFSNLGESVLQFDRDRYLLVTQYDITAYTEVWTTRDRFVADDFYALENCTNAASIYSNGEFDLYYVYAIPNQ
ncbi:MAG: hypothetical protein AB1793_08345 [Candidatus Thermoplasmatota archaeon]